MTETNLQSFVNATANLVRDTILTPISQYLASRGAAVSVDELAGVLNLPARQQSVVSPFGGAVPPLASVAPTSSARKTPASLSFVQGQTCCYQFKRGVDIQGKYCGKNTVGGALFCSTHLKAQTKNGAIPVSAPGIAPGMGGVPAFGGGFAGMPTMPGMVSSAHPVVQAPPAQPPRQQLDVEDWKDVNGLLKGFKDIEGKLLYRDIRYSYIVTPTADGTSAFPVCKLNAQGGIDALTEADRPYVTSLGMGFPQLAAAPAPTFAPAPSFPAVQTAFPAVSAVPTMPQAIPVQTAFPAVSAVPTMPQAIPVQTTAFPTVSAVPTMPQAIPVMPSVPAIPSMLSLSQPVAAVPAIPSMPMMPQSVASVPAIPSMPTIPGQVSRV